MTVKYEAVLAKGHVKKTTTIHKETSSQDDYFEVKIIIMHENHNNAVRQQYQKNVT